MYSKLNYTRNKHVLHVLKCTSVTCVKKFHVLNSKNNLNSILKNKKHVYYEPTRDFSLVLKTVKGLLKLRYILLGSAVGGGYQIKKKYDDILESIPNLDWLKKQFDHTFENVDSNWENSFKLILSKAKEITDKTSVWIEEAKEAQKLASLSNISLNLIDEDAQNESYSFKRKQSKNSNEDFQKILSETERKYQEKILALEKERTLLRQQVLLLKNSKAKEPPNYYLKKSLIDLYSEVLDDLQSFDSSSSIQDLLPRVVVVGDQSAGKTSVLEMIVNARIFPRGCGEMMTRSPVQVTLREGPYHVAKFNDSSKEYDLNDENQSTMLRNEIEYRMKMNLQKGEAISNKVISLNIQGPNLKRVVLVDLPGVINTVTTEMSPETKEKITKMTNSYMNNPNSIILCIQDGSLDVEKSLVTDFVSKADPDGRRTVFVLTKVDLAEKQWIKPDRLKKILDGKLFPMKALGYFGVVTGRGKMNETIESIRQYEDDFFKKSKLVRDGILNLEKCKTSNLVDKVSECFWDMVKSTVESQADFFKAMIVNYETQWKNEFRQIRELTREELFEKLKTEMLDEIVNLNLVKDSKWEEIFKERTWNTIKDDFFEKIYFPFCFKKNKTQLELNINKFLTFMPKISSQIAYEEFLKMYEKYLFDVKKQNYDNFHDNFKKIIIEEKIKKNYKWENKVESVLEVVQNQALKNNSICNKNEWNKSISFFKKLAYEKIDQIEKNLENLVGSSYIKTWYSWKYNTKEQVFNQKIKDLLEDILKSKKNENFHILEDIDKIFIMKNFNKQENKDLEKNIDLMWSLLIKRKALQDALKRAEDCKRQFNHYQLNITDELECEDIILFKKMDNMLSTTAVSLRVHLSERECQRFDESIKDALLGIDEDFLNRGYSGKRVELVEHLAKLRNIKKKLDFFIHELKKKN